MNSILEEIKSTFHLQMTDSFEAVDFATEMQDLLNEYPWFGLGWLALATESDNKIQQKANLWFNDSFVLNSFLQGNADTDKWLQDALLDVELESFDKKSTLSLEEQLADDVTTEESNAEYNSIVAIAEEAAQRVVTESLVLQDTLEIGIDESVATEKELEDINVLSVNEPIAPTVEEKEEAVVEEIKDAAAELMNDNEIASEEFEDDNEDKEEQDKLLSDKAEKILATLRSINLEDDETIAKQKLSYETYHIIDYFASQGIEISPEDLNKDEFGKQVRSFTEWLKTTKKIANPTPHDGPLDQLVETHAIASLSEKEVLTEAMAQVLVKQGKTRKAIELYGKLILMYPEKSHYFANRIKEINNIV